LITYGQDLKGLQHESESIYITFRDAMIDALAIQQQGIKDIKDAAGSAIESYRDANSGLLSVRGGRFFL
jgi:hypothetical protein